MEPTMLKLAVQQAQAKGQTVGEWLAEAIRDKIEREGEGNVT